jgi:hypothetical protein
MRIISLLPYLVNFYFTNKYYYASSSCINSSRFTITNNKLEPYKNNIHINHTLHTYDLYKIYYITIGSDIIILQKNNLMFKSVIPSTSKIDEFPIYKLPINIKLIFANGA